ncbi:MAG: hypothetical protein HND52_11395 [Ignavibacteriae bacterium]|nr:hypothetical protein [Ignavibacteriota bacterium]NOG98553.1 hypothetical protein [Ignavibacteriota bacterium]
MQKYVLLSVMLVIITTSITAQVNFFNQRDFADAFGRACGKIKNLPNEPISQPNTQNAYSAVIIGQHEYPGYGVVEVLTIKQPAVILNYGNRFEYAMLTQVVPAEFQKRIFEEIKDFKNDFIEEYDDINAAWTIVNNQIAITANYIYNDADGGDIQNRLAFLMRFSQRLVTEILKETESAKNDRRDDLEDSSLSYLSRLDLNCLMPREEFENWTMEDSEAIEGAYGYTLREIDVEVKNYGSRIEFIYEDFLPDDISDDNTKKIIKKLSAAANDYQLEGNPELEIFVPEYFTGNICVKAIYKFNNSFTGDDLKDYFEDFMEDFLNEMDKEFDDIVDEIEG